MVVLDTNVVSELFKPVPSDDVATWYFSSDPEHLFITAITKAESLLGCALMSAGRKKRIFEDVLTTFYQQRLMTPVLAFGSEEAGHFADIVSRRRSIGRPIGEFDAQIAAIARSHGFAVATRNIRDFEHCGVTVINPWEPA